MPARAGLPAPAPPSPTGRGQGTGDGWPLRNYLELGAYRGVVPCARLHARQVLWEWDLADVNDRVELLVSELVTNAVNASGSMDSIAPVRLWLLSDQAHVLILVGDTSSRPPIRTHADEADEGGRGLLLVEAISDEWNWYVPQARAGKVVWALVRTNQCDQKDWHRIGPDVTSAAGETAAAAVHKVSRRRPGEGCAQSASKERDGERHQ